MRNINKSEYFWSKIVSFYQDGETELLVEWGWTLNIHFAYCKKKKNEVICYAFNGFFLLSFPKGHEFVDIDTHYQLMGPRGFPLIFEEGSSMTNQYNKASRIESLGLIDI